MTFRADTSTLYCVRWRRPEGEVAARDARVGQKGFYVMSRRMQQSVRKMHLLSCGPNAPPEGHAR